MEVLGNFDFDLILQNANQRKKITSAQYPIFCSSEQYFAVLKIIANKEITPNLKLINEIIEKQNTKPWLLFLGGVGRGKSINMHVLASFIKTIYKLNSLFFSATTQICQNDELAQSCKTAQMLVLDDLGVESNLQNKYGNKISIINEIIEYRYNYNLPTYITTNLKGHEMQQHSGVRVVDRIKENCGIVNFDNYFTKSFR